MWKTLSGALAVSDSLKSRGMKVDFKCQICGSDPETINHILFTCPMARQVWALSNFPSMIGGYSSSSIYANFYHLLMVYEDKRVPFEIRRIFPWILWVLWKNRNKMVFEGKVYEADKAADKAMEDARQWFIVQELYQQPMADDTGSQNSPVVKWEPPPLGFVKCNVGVAWSKKKLLSGASWVLRDHMGKVLMHSRRAYTQISTDFEAKVRSIQWAVESIRSLRFMGVIFAVDAIEIVSAVRSPREWPA